MLELVSGFLGGNLGYAALGLAALVGGAYFMPAIMTLVAKFRTQKVLTQNQQNQQVTQVAVQKVDTQVAVATVELAKVEQKIEDLASKEVTGTDIVNFLTDMQDQADKEKK